MRFFLFICQLMMIESLAIFIEDINLFTGTEIVLERIRYIYYIVRCISTVLMLYGLNYSVLRSIEEDNCFRSYQEEVKRQAASGSIFRVKSSKEVSLNLNGFLFVVKE